MRGYTLVELLLFISFVEPVEIGVVEGLRGGPIGTLIGLLVGLLIASLWIALFLSWARRYWDKLRSGAVSPGLFISIVFLMMLALPVVTAVITHRLIFNPPAHYHGI